MRFLNEKTPFEVEEGFKKKNLFYGVRNIFVIPNTNFAKSDSVNLITFDI